VFISHDLVGVASLRAAAKPILVKANDELLIGGTLRDNVPRSF
jgi:hypothetical protein